MRIFLVLAAVLSVFVSCIDSGDVSEAKVPGAYHAMRLMTDSRAYPYADIPPSGYHDGIDYSDKMRPTSDIYKSANQSWEPMGPLNTSGRCLALAINPLDDETVYLGSASGGLWRSRSLGLDDTWEYVPTGHNVLAVSSIAFAPSDSMTMYIGTGEVYNHVQTGNDGAYRATRGSYGVGILKSVDGGTTWAKSLDWSYQNQKGVQAIAIDQLNPEILFAATTDGVYRSSDAGGSWQLVLDVIMATDVVINGDTIIAGCGNLGSARGGIYRSTNGGISWSRVDSPEFPNGFQGKIELDAPVADPNIVYASVGNGFGFSDGATWILRTEDAGESWTMQSDEDYSKWQGWFSHDIAVHPSDHDQIMAVGIDIWSSNQGGQNLQKRSSGGVTLGRPRAGAPDGPPNYSHSDHHVALYHPSHPDTILFGNDGGLFLSFDGGTSFRSANYGMQTTQFYNGFSVSTQDASFAMGGLQDNSTSIFLGDGDWQRAFGGDGSWTAIHPVDDQLVFASSQRLRIGRSTDRGSSYSIPNLPTEDDEPIFIAPYMISPDDPNVMYAAGTRIYKSTAAGLGWTVVNSGQPLNGDPVYAMALADTDRDMIVVATAPYLDRSAIFLSLDGGITFDDITTDNLPDRFVNDIVIDTNDPSRMLICYSGFGSSHLYESLDFGQSWTDISLGLPDLPTNAIALDPEYPEHIYIGNDHGVYFSDDGGSSWSRFSLGLPDAIIAMDLKISPSDRKLWVATHGHGTYRRPLLDGNSTATAETASDLWIRVFPNPATDVIQISAEEAIMDIQTVELFDITGRLLQSESFTQTRGPYSFRLGANVALTGSYTLKMTTTNGTSVNHPILIKR